MARIEPVYRHHDERPGTATSSCLDHAVSGLPQRRGICLSGLHRRSLRTETPHGQYDNRRTRSPRTGDDDSQRRRGPWRFEVPGSKHHSTPKVVSAFADIVVSANDEIPGQHLLTLSRKDIQKGESLFWRTAESLSSVCPIQNRTPKRLTAGVLNRSTINTVTPTAQWWVAKRRTK